MRHHAWSLRTLGLLASAHPELQRFATSSLARSPFDLTVYSKGVWRSEDEQEQAVRDGASKLHYPDSIHNRADWITAEEVLDGGVPREVLQRMRVDESGEVPLYPVNVEAIDFGPVKPRWQDLPMWYSLAGYFRRIAEEEEIEVVSGLDWNSNWKFIGDQTFWDGPHWQRRHRG